MFGLTESTLELLQEYFLSRKEIVKVLIFGSRAMGNKKPGSDIYSFQLNIGILG